MAEETRTDTETPPGFAATRDGERIAYRALAGRLPTLVFLGGFSSDMGGTKARHLEALCRRRGQRYLRFDYRGHGASTGRFEDGTIGAWCDDALTVIRQCTEGPLVLVGSSMGAWIMLLAAREISERVDALIGIAAAVDFTEDLIWSRMSAAERARLLADGELRIPSQYAAEGMPITLELIEEARRHLLLREPVPVACPVRLIHGRDDRDVPWQTSLALLEVLDSPDATLTLVESSDHRMSSPGDLARLARVVEETLDAAAQV